MVGRRAQDWAPPHTRGSTHGKLEQQTRSGLPRTRGDRPVPAGAGGCVGAPPHTRGSTPGRPASQPDNAGSPAHAGIDPPARRRIRLRAPPHTRGSTLLDFDGRTLEGLPRTRGDRPGSSSARISPSGSPAHAGIDPRRDPIAGKDTAPPHTRGSTLPGSHPSGHRGSPAHAGIDPRRPVQGRDPGLPRTRGDRPSPASVSGPAPPHTRGSTRVLTRFRRKGEAPPHTRGSTRRRYRPQPSSGSPAHAGIDPGMIYPSGSRAWLPRTRGDRPAGRKAGADLAGSPAHAGIDPRKARPCLAGAAPPHTRGSTQEMHAATTGGGSPAHAGIDPRVRRSVAGLGSPAHAGIDLQYGTGRVRARAPPHTRDRPTRTNERRRWRLAPRTRGDRLCMELARRTERHGTPAHAGIDP